MVREVIERAREWGAPYPEALAQLVLSAALREEAELPSSEIEQALDGYREINACVRPKRAQRDLLVRMTSIGGGEKGGLFFLFSFSGLESVARRFFHATLADKSSA